MYDHLISRLNIVIGVVVGVVAVQLLGITFAFCLCHSVGNRRDYHYITDEDGWRSEGTLSHEIIVLLSVSPKTDDEAVEIPQIEEEDFRPGKHTLCNTLINRTFQDLSLLLNLSSSGRKTTLH